MAKIWGTPKLSLTISIAAGLIGVWEKILQVNNKHDSQRNDVFIYKTIDYLNDSKDKLFVKPCVEPFAVLENSAAGFFK